jgi:hypothetical protein
MKKFLLLLILPLLSFASTQVGIDPFDQGKLEQLIRRIPNTVIRTEKHQEFVRKFSEFPRSSNAPFIIKCWADFYGKTEIPSHKNCEIHLMQAPDAGRVSEFRITDSHIVEKLFSAISYGVEQKKLNSHELVYAQSSSGTYKNHFRYSFICSNEYCEISFVVKSR